VKIGVSVTPIEVSTVRSFDLAGIGTPDLKASFEFCRAVHGKTDPQTYLAVELLPLQTRPHAHRQFASEG